MGQRSASPPDDRQLSRLCARDAEICPRDAVDDHPRLPVAVALRQSRGGRRSRGRPVDTGCRSKHLKCDGLVPCTRCVSNSLDCVYVRSRRGFKGPRRNGGPVIKSPDSPATPSIIASSKSFNPPYLKSSNGQGLQTCSVPTDPANREPQPLVAFDPKQVVVGDIRERCIEAFFFHFFPAHPFTLPRRRFMALRKEKPLRHLEAAMRYIGSFYVPQDPHGCAWSGGRARRVQLGLSQRWV